MITVYVTYDTKCRTWNIMDLSNNCLAYFDDILDGTLDAWLIDNKDTHKEEEKNNED